MTRRPTAAVYRRRRLTVAVIAGAVLIVLIWLVTLAVGAVSGGNDKAAGIVSGNPSPTTANSDVPTPSVTPVPVGGRCDAGDIVVRPVAQEAYASEPVTLKFQVFTLKNPQCVWKATHGSVQIGISQHARPFWSTVDCPNAVVEQTVTLRQGTPVTLTLAQWNGHGSSQAGGCGVQGPWSRPAAYIVQAAALGGNPSIAALNLVAPGQPLVQPTPKATATASPTASGSTTPKPSGSGKPTAGATQKSTPSPTPTLSVWQ
jgi:hypothetical protein